MSNLGGIDLFVQILCPESILWPILSDLGVQIWPFLDLFFSLRNGLFFVVFSKLFFSLFTTKFVFYWVYTLQCFCSLLNGNICSLLNSLFWGFEFLFFTLLCFRAFFRGFSRRASRNISALTVSMSKIYGKDSDWPKILCESVRFC